MFPTPFAFAAWVACNIHSLEGALKCPEGTVNRRNARGHASK